ncbi:hypothetical protein [Longispora albida]|uniref:hypothetical protein n=1 Tax=Longispora albida TaxID=203523 RepID=UPI001FE23A48|nr:hypothetical protein [Longispora albida]
MSTSAVPPLLQGLIDDAAVFPPGNAPLPAAIIAHREHRAAWYARFVGPLLVKASTAASGELRELVEPAERFQVGLIGDTGPEGLSLATTELERHGIVVRQYEVAVPVGQLRGFLADERPAGITAYVELSRSQDWRAGLDLLAGSAVMPKFRTGGLSAELFPSVGELADILVACRERGLRVKLTAGLHHAARHADPVTGFTHHGFLNILAACLEPGREAELLAVTDPEELAGVVRPYLGTERQLWVGFGTCSVTEPLEDVVKLGLAEEEKK